MRRWTNSCRLKVLPGLSLRACAAEVAVSWWVLPQDGHRDGRLASLHCERRKGQQGPLVWDFCGEPCHRQESEQNTLVLRLRPCHDRSEQMTLLRPKGNLSFYYFLTPLVITRAQPFWLFTEPREAEGDNQGRTISLQRRHVPQCPQLDPWLALAAASAPLLLARCARCSCGPAGDCESAAVSLRDAARTEVRTGTRGRASHRLEV